MSRYRRRVDEAQPGMVKELRAAGYSVIDTHAVGGDAPDIIVGKHGRTVLVEIKTAKRAKEHKARLVEQAAARAAWGGGSFIQATTAAEVVREFHTLYPVRPLV